MPCIASGSLSDSTIFQHHNMTPAQKVAAAFKIYQHHHSQALLFMKNTGASWEEALARFEMLRPDEDDESSQLFDVIADSMRHYGQKGFVPS